ncbi:MAG: nucleotide exchange factor GrpE [Amoebophilaceae bacterium]|jgi:molecular chaperone GrpE|nr:nucleotide exchange factor GrpE [Amoebophilaceae bacterium]
MQEDLAIPKTSQEATLAKEKEVGKEGHPLQEPDKSSDALAEAHDKYLRLYSEFENFRRRAAKEKLSLIETAGASILKKLLPIADDFERALESLQAADEATQAIQAGIRLIHDKLVHLLQQAGVQPMPVERGMTFDAELHEAVTQIPTDDEDMQGKVLEVLEKGYLLQEKVLRFAKVVTGA